MGRELHPFYSMKTLLKLLAIFLICSANALFAGDSAVFQSIPTAVTNLATASTNSVGSDIISLYDGQTPVRIWLSATGLGGTTNGALTVKFSTASGRDGVTNNLDTAASSVIKVTMATMNGATKGLTTTNTVSDWFVLKGARYIQAGQIENTFGAAVSNISVQIGYTRSTQ